MVCFSARISIATSVVLWQWTLTNKEREKKGSGFVGDSVGADAGAGLWQPGTVPVSGCDPQVAITPWSWKKHEEEEEEGLWIRRTRKNLASDMYGQTNKHDMDDLEHGTAPRTLPCYALLHPFKKKKTTYKQIHVVSPNTMRLSRFIV